MPSTQVAPEVNVPHAWQPQDLRSSGSGVSCDSKTTGTVLSRRSSLEYIDFRQATALLETPPPPDHLDANSRLQTPVSLRSPASLHDSDSDEEDAPVLEDDPTYASREELFDSEELHDSIVDTDSDSSGDPPAFSEDPAIRNAYIEAFLAATFQHATHDLVQSMLEGQHAAFLDLSQRLGGEIPGLDRMAHTLRTAERRLGLDPDEHIVYYFLCDICWFRHHPSELHKLDGPGCTQDGCTGTLYVTKQMSGGRVKRVPVKIFPVAPLINSLQQILLRPGKYEVFQHWRRAGDEPGPVPPMGSSGLDAFPDPSVRMTDVYDGWGWRAIQAGLARRRGGKWGVQDVDVHELNQRFVSLPCGLVLMFNIDWFCSMKKSRHSTGAIYVTICNNPRHIRFLRLETILVCTLPGPHEPSLEQLNHVLEPLVEEVIELGNGTYMACKRHIPSIHGFDDRQLIHGGLYANVSDLPASRKAAGLRGPTSKEYTCTYCYLSFDALTDPKCFCSDSLRLRDDWRYLKYAFRARDADADDREQIAEERGVRWSALDLIPGWMPARCSPPEFMHAGYLIQIKHSFQEILVGSGLFTSRSRTDKPLAKLEQFLGSIWWPSSSGRVPHKIAEGGSVKADQWRNLVHVLPVALYYAWEVSGVIPDGQAPRPKPTTNAGKALAAKENLIRSRRRAHLASQPNVTKAMLDAADALTISRSYREHFNNVLEFCAAIRIWGSRSISPEEVMRAHGCHARACQSWATMHCHLTPYFHLATHNPEFFLRLGPAYAWWAYPYERNNGFLGRFKTNGHTGGELEATMMRGWVKSQLVHNLISRLENLQDKSDADRRIIVRLKSLIASESRPNQQRGTLLNLIGQMAATESPERVQHPKHPRKLKLRQVGIYGLILQFLKTTWGHIVQLAPDTAPVDAGEPFVASHVPFYSHILVDGIRYGVHNMRSGQGYCYAYFDGRIPARISHLLRVTHIRRDPALPSLETTCAVVQRFVSDDDIPVMPWAMRATDLGIATWSSDVLAAPEVIEVSRFSGQFALATVRHGEHSYWVTMSLCHDTQEPDLLDVDDVGNEELNELARLQQIAIQTVVYSSSAINSWLTPVPQDVLPSSSPS
ncbi:uncharacterized protein C8Q71DRAFT_893893 [Rhodofomes roseus]|uniref:PcfJ-like protein n=1 Tax=Rhodofomes roseus TaxID=34475 RepID=A0ABQ8KL39_9APHY|nr:uncharacterized protein C8Q71DRAFT_893893 [Rhodofomes roseus]KAH9839027.1 hypothetical protein C8Q71DRAFT_893893 [Rhodofomes roseus]